MMKNLILLTLTIAIMLLIGETATRYFLGGKLGLFPRFTAAADYGPVTLRRLVPETVFKHTYAGSEWEFRTNAQGFRDDENYPKEKPAGEFRVLVLGDSHTEGYEARQDKIFAEVLEKRLRAHGIKAKILNTGISGLGTAEELLFLKYEGMKYHPDAVILAFYENDFEDNLKSGLFTFKEGELIRQADRHVPGTRVFRIMNAVPGVSWLSQNSYFFSLALNTAWETAKAALRKNARSRAVTHYAVRRKEIDQYERDLTLALLRQIKEITSSAGIPFVVIEIPAHDPGAERGWFPSFPPDMAAEISGIADSWIPAEAYLGQPGPDAPSPYLHHHISEDTHARIAAALETVLKDLSGKPATNQPTA